MFSSGPNYTKLKTNLRLAIARLKLLEKKKTELTEKSRREIADYIRDGKIERAKIRVEYIIREDYMVEAMEIVEMYCDLLLARFGLITNMKDLDSGIAEPVASLIWVAPRLQSDCNELKVIGDLLAAKYGPNFAEACRVESIETINAKLKHKLSIHSPPKLLVEKYVIEIAKTYNVPYEPDPQVMETEKGTEATLIDLGDKNNLDGNGGGAVIPDFPHPPGFLGYPQPPPLPNLPNDPTVPFNYPPLNPPSDMNFKDPSAPPPAAFSYNIPPEDTKEKNTDYMGNLPSYNMIYPDFNKDDDLQNEDVQPPEETSEDNVNGTPVNEGESDVGNPDKGPEEGETLSEEPVNKSQEEKPGDVTQEEKPEGETQEEKPEDETQEEKPDGETQEEKPDGETQEEKLDGETQEEKPEDETEEKKPEDESLEENDNENETDHQDDNVKGNNFPPRADQQINDNLENKDEAPKPLPRSKINDNVFPHPPPGLPELPSVPTGLPGFSNNQKDEDIDFDDLNRRFNELKKKK